uniref:Immunoglobulin domain-containing protein n=1 Tax=Sus scrofa TaxID=9823 RepID=A0A8D1EZD7_PIG
MGGGSTTPILMALLCLGEPWGRRDWAPLPPGLGPERPGDTGASVGEELLGRGDGLSPGSDPSTQGPDQTWSICVERGGAHGDSLPGLCWRPWDQVQAGESPQHPLEALFPLGPVNASHGGTYRCYDSPSSDPYLWSQPSDPLHLQVTGVYREPSLSAQPGSLVLLGDRLTLQCRSDAGFGRFALTKDEGSTPPLRLDGQHSPDFPLGRVSHTRGGRYRCYAAHNLSDAWSAPSAPLDILIAGMYRKPSLSAHPGTSVSWGENVTLQCLSEIVLDTFHLFKEGSLAPAQNLRLQDMVAPLQANFTLSPMTSAHNETYRCYTSQSTSPYVLSNPSDPLQLLISGKEPQTWSSGSWSVQGADLRTALGLPWYLSLLIGVSVAFVLLLLLLLFLLIRQRQRHRALMTKNFGENILSSQTPRPLPSPSPCLSPPQQEAESEGPQDVTYAQLNHVTLRQGTMAPPPSQAGEPPAEPSVYATLAIHQPTKDPEPRD